MKQKLFFAIIMLLSVGLFSCKDDKVDKQTTVTVQSVFPEGFSNATISGIVISVKNVTTGITENFNFESTTNGTHKLTLFEGLYDFSYEGTMEYDLDDKKQTDKVKAYKESVQITGETSEVSLELFISKESADFVIAEIFFTGTLTPEGKQYTGDKYFRIFNNSDQVLYADGLAIIESDFLTVSKYNYTPDIMSQAMAVDAIYRIPGTGTEYPVEPGKSILICDNAIDHRSANSNSFDLSSADFEWYDESTNPNFMDIDNPAVTNMDKIYCYTLTIWGPHNRGFKSYALGRLGVDKENYLSNYTYEYEYDIVTEVGTFPMTGEAYRFPNEWIIDAVNLSVEAEFQWIVTDPSLDMGWTYCGKINSDTERYGKSVRRKVLTTTADGRKILKDTNNSTLDFDAEQTANPFYFD